MTHELENNVLERDLNLDIDLERESELLNFDGVFHQNVEVKIKLFEKEKTIKFIPAYIELRILNAITELENKKLSEEKESKHMIDCVFMALNYFFPKEIKNSKDLLSKCSMVFISSFYSFLTSYIFEGFDKKKTFQEEILKKLQVQK